MVVDAEVDRAFKALRQHPLRRHIHRDRVLCREILWCKIRLRKRAQMAVHLRVGIKVCVPPAAAQGAAQRRRTCDSVPVRVSVGDDQYILMRQQELCALFIVHYPHPHRA